MTFEFLRKSLGLALTLAVASNMGCAADVDLDTNNTAEEAPTEADPGTGFEFRENTTETASQVDAVADIAHTAVKDQSIGNCWIYATAGWMESLRKTYNGEELNTSESYLTYWDWFRKIQGGKVGTDNKLPTGGSWGDAVELFRTRGYMLEAAFLPEEATAEMSAAQQRALTAINTSLATGALSTAAARANGTLVRDELDRAFGLRAEMVSELDRVFGADGVKTLQTTSARRDFVKRPTQLYVGRTRTSTGTTKRLSLSDVIGVPASSWNNDRRVGAYVWNGFSYPSSASERVTLLRRVQRAMNDGYPVIFTWLVDFNALTSDGTFSMDQLRTRGIGSQGAHLTVVDDYAVTNVPGRGDLGLGALSEEEQTLALQGDLTLFRIKNSWGAYRSPTGYHDLSMGYLNGPIQWKGENASATARPATPLSWVTLPPGY